MTDAATDTLPAIAPLTVTGDEPVALAVQSYLRRLVLNGTLPPGATISQVTLARALGVSRTPLREALRMLQEEGLIEAEPNRQARVTSFDPAELDHVYGCRISMESVAVAMTAASAPSELLDEIDRLLDAMEARSAEGDEDGFAALHREFHRSVLKAAPEGLQRTIATFQGRTERYSRLLVLTEASPHSARDREHREIAAALRRADSAGASEALAGHLARTALTLMVQMAPSRDAVTVRTALAMVSGQLPSA